MIRFKKVSSQRSLVASLTCLSLSYAGPTRTDRESTLGRQPRTKADADLLLGETESAVDPTPPAGEISTPGFSTFINPMYRPTGVDKIESAVDPTPLERPTSENSAVVTDVDRVDSEPEGTDWEAYCRACNRVRQAVHAKALRKRYRIYTSDWQLIKDAYLNPEELQQEKLLHATPNIMELNRSLERNMHQSHLCTRFNV